MVIPEFAEATAREAMGTRPTLPPAPLEKPRRGARKRRSKP